MFVSPVGAGVLRSEGAGVLVLLSLEAGAAWLSGFSRVLFAILEDEMLSRSFVESVPLDLGMVLDSSPLLLFSSPEGAGFVPTDVMVFPSDDCSVMI